MIANSVASFLKFVVSVKGEHCEYSARAPQIPATPLNTDGRYHSRLPVRVHTSSRKHYIRHIFVRIFIGHEDPYRYVYNSWNTRLYTLPSVLVAAPSNVQVCRPLACWDCGFESRRGHECLLCMFALSSRGVCVGQITCPEESYPVWRV